MKSEGRSICLPEHLRFKNPIASISMLFQIEHGLTQATWAGPVSVKEPLNLRA